jgi:hypothetical protein
MDAMLRKFLYQDHVLHDGPCFVEGFFMSVLQQGFLLRHHVRYYIRGGGPHMDHGSQGC